MTWREATRDEIHQFYTQEFPNWIDELPSFISSDGPKEYAIAFRDSHPIKKDEAPAREFIRRGTRDEYDSRRRGKNFESFDHIVNFIQRPARHDPFENSDYALVDPDLLDKPDPLPAGVYYSLDHWERSWIILVDIDAKDIALERGRRLVSDDSELSDEEIRSKAGILDAAPEGYPYAFEDIEQALEYGFTVRDIFEDDFAAEETMVVYSGQGCHVYLLDDDRDHQYDTKSREVLVDYLTKRREIPIDSVVTADRKRVARLPYTLHTDVSRVVQPIESPTFDFRRVPTPEFLSDDSVRSMGVSE